MPLYQKVLALIAAVIAGLFSLLAVGGLVYALYRTIRYRSPLRVNFGVTYYNHFPEWRRLWAERKGETVSPEQMEAWYASSERVMPPGVAIVIGIVGVLVAFYAMYGG